MPRFRAAIAGVSTLNLLQLAVIGWGSVPANMVSYSVIHGGTPPSTTFERSTGSAFWRPFMEFPLPWQYLAATGIVFLLVATLVAIKPSLQFVATRTGWEFWRTTPALLTALGVVFTFSTWSVARYYSPIDTVSDPYLVGTLAAALGTIFIGLRVIRDLRRS